MRLKQWISGLAAGAGAGLIVAVVMTFIDWRLNPGGIFHEAGKTDWSIVWDTALSWFWPVAAFASIAVLVTLSAKLRLRR